jgi:DNA-binding CsgD family transcriptional regulator
VLITEEEYLAHYGVIRRSGRYPYGSGGQEHVTKNHHDFMSTVNRLAKEGMSQAEIAQVFGMTSTTQLRAAYTNSREEALASDTAMTQRLKDKGWSNVAIAERLGVSEGKVRNMLAAGENAKKEKTALIVDILKKEIDSYDGYIDVGTAVENYLGVSKEKLNQALEIMKSDGYEVISGVKIPQIGTQFETNFKVLAKPGTQWKDVKNNPDKIKLINQHIDDTGRSVLGMLPPLPLNPRRLAIRYKEDGGAEADGVMYIRPGVDDLSIGGSKYAQVRIQVGNSHYLKGMAIYKNDLPDGVDVVFNSNKSDTGNKLDALKPLSDNPDNRFGAVIRRQITKTDTKGKEKTISVVNIVNEEGDWSDWSRNISAQALSKQSHKLAKEQLDMTYERRLNNLNGINKLTNPVVKQKLLEEFAESTDSAAVHLKAASLPRQAWHTILPINSLKPTEIYAPNYKDGERVALIRYPHGGTFEIPELIVNNSNREAKRSLGEARDAVGIHHKVAERLSGADFDGDTVLLIPNNKGKIKSSPALEGLKNFDPKEAYPGYPGMKVMRNTQKEMGLISNLITDMTIKGASQSELARAVRHSMVVIDAEKKELNYKESEKVNGIKQLKEKYQTKPDGTGGASTLISRAGSQTRIPNRKPRYQQDGGPINKKTGELQYQPTNETYSSGKLKTTKLETLAVTKDANTLSSGTPMEKLYGNHSNKLKALANQARLDMINTPTLQYSPSAKKVYQTEVDKLNADLKVAIMNKPKERQAIVLANSIMKIQKENNPQMDKATEKKLSFQALNEARNRTGAKKNKIKITPKQWEAIQAGAITPSKLKDILDNADMDIVRDLATPKTQVLMTSAKTNRAKSMLASGYTRAEVAEQLGVSLSTLDEATL